jgi:hypothetical protein
MDGNTIFINALRRAVRVTDTASTCVITGTDKIRSGYGNGDCILLDFANRIFAVADGTERYPWASRGLLERLQQLIAAEKVPESVEEWEECIGALYAGQEYHQKTTFSAVALADHDRGLSVFVMHGGDSSVMIMDSRDGSVRYRTKPDMNFAGRSAQVHVSAQLLTEEQVRIVIATDGLNDVMKFSRQEISRVPDLFLSAPVHEVGERLYHLLEGNGGIEYDDLGLIILNPFRVHPSGDCVIIGGTTPNEELRFYRDASSRIHNRWMSTIEWRDNVEMLRVAGIRICSG